jgi:hypothetical protein
MNYQGRAILASVIFALLVFLLIETLPGIHQRIQNVLLLHPQIVFVIIMQVILASTALYIHYTRRYDKKYIGHGIACISFFLTLYILYTVLS